MNIVDSVIFVYTKHSIHMKEKKESKNENEKDGFGTILCTKFRDVVIMVHITYEEN
jgi:hypothetical protein